MENYQSEGMAQFFNYQGDGKQTKERRWRIYRYLLKQFREMHYNDLERITAEYDAAAKNIEFASLQQNIGKVLN